MIEIYFEPTDEDLEEASDYFARMEYECRPFSVICRSCGSNDTGSQMELEKKGWKLTWKGETCPASTNGSLNGYAEPK